MAADRPTDPGLLIALELLIVDDPAAPRRSADAGLALERLAWLGRPVVLAGERIADRRLPEATDDRIAWVRGILERDDLSVARFDEPPIDRPGDEAERDAVACWVEARRTWSAGWLLTGRSTSVGPARRAGLSVARIGPRDTTVAASVERADHEARDLLEAVSHLLTRETFGLVRPT